MNPLVETLVTVKKVLSDRTCHAHLPNGKQVFGFIPVDDVAFPLDEGALVRARLNVADFSRAELLRPEATPAAL